jgi:hypothetical protein
MALDDTRENMSWHELEMFLKRCGFTIIRHMDIEYEGEQLYYLIAAHLESKLLVVAESAISQVWEHMVGWCTVYGSLRLTASAPIERVRHVFAATDTHSVIRDLQHPGQIVDFSITHRQPVTSVLAGLESVGEFVNWGYDPDRVIDLRTSTSKSRGHDWQEDFFDWLDWLPRKVRHFIQDNPDRPARRSLRRRLARR